MRHTRIHLPVLASIPGSEVEGRKVNIPTDLPIIFSAGPIRNAPRWQSDTIRIALNRNHKVFFACPARVIDEDLVAFVESDRPDYEVFPRQRAWEQHYMYRAAKRGCIFFWLCQEAAEKEFPDKVYAHITMLELGKWIERKKLVPSTNLVIGTDEHFPEWSTIKYEIEQELPDFQIHYSLEETLDAALKISQR